MFLRFMTFWSLSVMQWPLDARLHKILYGLVIIIIFLLFHGFPVLCNWPVLQEDCRRVMMADKLSVSLLLCFRRRGH